ncbi:hypothetical protein G6F32_016776 [Rhizopus arrhizus]|nr:hypothetical protein G6F32_016776 [Rhizopus arrhizus]
MKGGMPDGLDSASSTRPKGSLSVRVNVLSPVAANSAPAAIIAWPRVSFLAQRCSDAMQSSAVTGEPSLNFRPGRKVKVHVLPSSDEVQVSTIWGLTWPLLSCENRVSNTM